MSFKIKPGKTLNCRDCGEPVPNVGHDADGVVCHACVSAQLSGLRVEKCEDDDENNSPNIVPGQS